MSGKQELKKILVDNRNIIRDASDKDIKAQQFADQIANLNKTDYPAFEAFSDLSGELAGQMDSMPQVLDKQTFLNDYALSPASIRTINSTDHDKYFIEAGLDNGDIDIVPYDYSDALSRIDEYLDYLN